MPLEGTDGRRYKWCMCCPSNILDTHKTLHVHLNRAHDMELLQRCPPSCFYFHSRWSNVKKNCFSHHHLDKDSVCSFGGCAWGLTPVDNRGGKPSYAGIHPENLCCCPLRTKILDTLQKDVVAKPTQAPQPGTSAQDTVQAASSQGPG